MNSRVILKDALKKFTTDQDKIFTPEETVARFREKTAALNLDILEETRRIDNGRLDIPVFFSVCGHDARKVTGTNKQMGKGATPAQSEASAVMELAERFSFFSFCKNKSNFFTDTYKNVKDRSIPFEMIAKSVHDNSEDLEAAEKIFENLPLKWTEAYNLTRDEEVLIPFNWFFMINEFNGPSAGNCNEEAICQGISEVVERHVSSLVSHGEIKVPLIDATTSKDPMVREMLEKYEKAGIKLYISDFTMDTGIPTVGVLGYDPETFPAMSEIVWTAGTTPDPEKALSRALTETAQLAGDFNTCANFVASGLPKYTRLDQAEFIMNPGKTVPLSTLPDLSDENIRIEILNMVESLKKIDMDVILINTTHKELEIPAFYTIIPGAHFRERALGTSVGMFAAKMISQENPPPMAAEKLLEADRILPGKYYIQFYIGSAYLAMEDPETALSFYEKAMELNPNPQDIPSICSYMGICLKDLGRYEDSLEVLRKGEAMDKERTDIYNLMGFCNFQLKRHEEAIDCFKQVIALDPSSAIDYANIASNYRDMGEVKKACTYYRMALELDPSIDFARDNLERLTSL